MKKLVNIIITLFTIVSFSQIDIKDTSGYNVYVADTLYSTHKNLSNALEKQFIVLKENPTAKVEILPYGKVTAVLSKDFFEGSKEVVHDTVFIGQELTKKTVDTTLFGWSANLLNDAKSNISYSLFLPDSTKVVQQVKLLNYSGLDCETCKRVPERTVLNVQLHYEGNYLVATEERVDTAFKIAYHVVRSQDSTSIRTQTYANDYWNFWTRESNTLDSLYKKPFVLVSINPGDGHTEYPDYVGELRRHTSTFSTKYRQILAIRQKDGYAIVMEVDENNLK